MDAKVLKCKTHEECLQFAKNAEDRGHPELAQQARVYSLELRAATHSPQSAVELAAYIALYAYEDGLAKKHGMPKKAIRTRGLIEDYGLIEALERAVRRPDDPDGFTVLKVMGLEEYSFERIVVSYPDQFSPVAVKRAKDRLARFSA